MTNIGVYVRISDDKDGESTATARQLKDCVQYAQGQGWDIVEVFEDSDFSASKRRVRRPSFERLLEAVKERRIDGVLAWRQDRLQRSLRDFVRLADICQDSGGFVVTMDGVDTRHLGGQILGPVLTVVAAAESKNLSSRVTRWHQERIENGGYAAGGSRRFGYSYQYDVVESEAELIREAFARLFAGESLRGVALDWERRGVLTPRGNAWRPETLKGMLVAPHLSAQRERSGVLTAGAWQPIVSPADTARIRAQLRDPARRNIKPARSYLLTHFIRCGVCGNPMEGVPPTKKSPPRYRCKVRRIGGPANCGKMSRLMAPIDAWVLTKLLEAYDGADLREYVARNRGEALGGVSEAIIVDEQALVEASHSYFVDHELTPEAFASVRDSLTARLKANRARLANTSTGVVLNMLDAGENLALLWGQKPLEWQRTVLATVIESIAVHPTARRGPGAFDPEALVLKWKF